jgi:hypothetical protein
MKREVIITRVGPQYHSLQIDSDEDLITGIEEKMLLLQNLPPFISATSKSTHLLLPSPYSYLHLLTLVHLDFL